MKKKKLLILVCLSLFLQGSVFTQMKWDQGSRMCSQKKMNSPRRFIIGDSPNSPKHSFDVLNYKLYLDLTNCYEPPSGLCYANVTVTFLVDTALSSIKLDAVNSSIVIDSVAFPCTSFTHIADILTINLNRTYSHGETVSVKIYYHHLNISDDAFYSMNGQVFTDCEPEGARKWFPCWDKPSDKATTELTARVPLNVKLGSNGSLIDSTVSGNSITYHWKSRDPMATYLVVISSKINYNLDIVYWHKLSNPSDSIPIRFYFGSGENPAGIESVIIPMMTYYSQKFCEHPFEKNGFASILPAPWSGGMENQTLTTLMSAQWNENLVSHEFAHQWFGDMITCGTWADIWLNEGFATYCEALWYEHTGGYEAYKQSINSDAYSYFQEPYSDWPIYNPEWAVTTPPNYILFDYAITYAKGSCVLHMLRYTLGDSLFFAVIKAYASDTADFKFKSAVTGDFITKVSQAAGQDMTWFFNEWVKEPKHPYYSNLYSFTPEGNINWRVDFFTRQVQTNTPFHKMPVVVKISFKTGPDTSIRVMNDVNDQTFSWTFSREPDNLVFDPNNDIPLKEGSTAIGIGPYAGVPGEYALYQNYPNPFNLNTTLRFDVPVESHVEIRIYNVLGEMVAKPVNGFMLAGKQKVVFSGENLASGIYYIVMKAVDISQTPGRSFTDARKMVLVK
jgi:aminopeptidase N